MHATATLDDPVTRQRDGTVVRSYLFIVLECDRPLAGSGRHALADIDDVLIGRGAAKSCTRVGSKLELRIPGKYLSQAHARLRRDGTDWIVEDQESNNGTFVNGERVTERKLSDGDVIDVGHTLLRYRAAIASAPVAQSDIDSYELAEPPGWRSVLPPVLDALAALRRIATTDVPVLLAGETGTGKELLARGIHAISSRAGQLIAVNCAALPATLVESQLFGYVKGAFTGATRDEPGMFRAADGGTLFLDEIGDLPLPAQAALLRVLQEREVIPVGGTKPVKVDVRFIAATHRDLTRAVEAGEFRRDLYARIAGYTHELPRLAERREDLGIIIADLLRDERPVQIAAEAGRLLVQHTWPLNIRELAQAISAALALSDGDVIDVPHLPRALTGGPLAAPDPDDQLRSELTEQLIKHHGNLAAVARAMGKARMQIHRWLDRFGLDPDKFRG